MKTYWDGGIAPRSLNFGTRWSFICNKGTSRPKRYAK